MILIIVIMMMMQKRQQVIVLNAIIKIDWFDKTIGLLLLFFKCEGINSLNLEVTVYIDSVILGRQNN